MIIIMFALLLLSVARHRSYNSSLEVLQRSYKGHILNSAHPPDTYYLLTIDETNKILLLLELLMLTGLNDDLKVR